MNTVHHPPVDPRILRLEAGPVSEFHLDNFTIQRIFFDARNAYMGGLGLTDLWRRPVTPSLRNLSVSFETSVPTTTPLTSTTRVVARSTRSFTMQQTLTVTGTQTVVATCTAVQVTVSRSVTGAVPIPDELWTAIEALERIELMSPETH